MDSKNISYTLLLKAGFNVEEFAELTKYNICQFLWCWIPVCIVLFETKIAITVKLFFIETRLKQGFDLWGYFLKIREMINVLTITVIHY